MVSKTFELYHGNYRLIFDNPHIHVIWLIAGTSHWYVRIFFGHKMKHNSLELELPNCPLDISKDLLFKISLKEIRYQLTHYWAGVLVEVSKLDNDDNCLLTLVKT